MTLWRIQRLGRRGDGVAEAMDPAWRDAAGAQGVSADASGTGADVRDNQRSSLPRVLASLVLPGEVIESEVGHDGRLAAPRIISASPDRVVASCPHYRLCGGCALMHAGDAFASDWKSGVVTRALAAQGINATVNAVHISPPRSRRRAVLAGRRTRKGALVGLHGRASDVIVDMQTCLVLRPAIVAALPLLRAITVAGASRSGELAITVTEGPEGLDVAVTGGKPVDGPLLSSLARLAEQGDVARLVWDGEALARRRPWQAMGRARVVPPPGGFLQATVEGQRALMDVVLGAVPPNARRVLDLFAGCGTFTLPLAERAEVHAVEGLSAPLSALDEGWRATPGLHRVTTESRDLARRPLLAAELAGFDAIVIDPPRAGAEAQAQAIAASAVPVVAWIACDPVTFARDARIMLAGGYRIERVEVIDQFRWSPHVETATVFRHSADHARS